MTHDELLADVTTEASAWANSHGQPDRYLEALLAVVELHTAGNGEASRCESCYMGFECPTIQAIIKELR